MEVQGVNMLLDQMKRLVHRLGMLRRHKTITPAAASAQAFGVEFDATWHGDHWQNLLASPLDARHYVMEDWAQPLSMPQDDIRDTSSPKRRRH